uniref:Intraflagellar transport protein 172 n=1 Tax=Plectus sambesii TaxID=2011161 RepID=A0A914VZ84_9BILA
DALRICKEYLPARLAELQDEYDNEQLKSGAKGALSFVAQAKDWEAQGDYERAVACYMKVVPPLTMDETLMLSCWTKAGDLAVKFLSEEQALVVVEQVAVQLQEIKRYSEAAELLLSANQTQQAVDVFVTAGEWGKAKKIAVELAPELAAYVDEKYKQSLRNEGKAGQLVDVDVLSGIDLYIEKGQWDRALEIAKQQNNAALLDKYVALYATELISNGSFMEAVEVFEKYGAAANPSAFNIYKRLIDEVIAKSNTNTSAAYKSWASLRNMLLSLVSNLQAASADIDPRYIDVFDRYLVIAHYYALRSALLKVAETEPAMKLAAMKLSVSLLRHCDLIPADKAFYEAGVACKDFGSKYESMAFVFLNHYLDLAEAIEEQNADGIDNADLEKTDIPTEFPLPDQLYLTPEQHEDMKEWVLAVSVDKQIEKRLITDQRGCYEASLVALDGSVSQPCIVTGYPVLDASKTFGTSDKVADRDDWNRLLMVHKTTKAAELDDVQKFIGSWTKTAISLAL